MVARTGLLIVIVAVLAATGGYFLASQLAPEPPGAGSLTGSSELVSRTELDAQALIGQVRPEFMLPDMQGNEVSISDFDGRPVLINFWATWCAPCVEEMPMLSELQAAFEDRGFQVIGIAIDDPQKAADFAEQLGVQYPVLVGMVDTVMVGRQYGNRGGMLPYSVLIDAERIVRWTQLGALVREDVTSQIESML